MLIGTPRASCMHHNSCLVSLATASCTAQVATLGTIMELIRGQQAGVFDKALFSKAMTVLLQSQTVSEDVLQLLISKYMPCADVR